MVDFGVYHHSTREDSERMRILVRKTFVDAMLSRLPEDEKIRILDAGCGLGFLSYIAAITYPNASVTGVDIFQNESLKNSSMDKAMGNMMELGLSERVSIRNEDLTNLDFKDNSFDLVISNLVFHNMGKDRFRGYSEIWRVTRKMGYFILGDIFFRESEEMTDLQKHFSLIETIRMESNILENYSIKIFQKP